VIQSPWAEGQNVRHLEPLGFIKFDILGLSSLRMIDTAIRHILARHKKIENPTFEDVQDFYNEHLHPDVMDFNDQSVFENIFHQGRWAGIFQFSETGAQNFCKLAKPTSITELAAVTSIFRPGPLASGVSQNYVATKDTPEDIVYDHPILKEILEETFGFCIFQEQIATIAHRLGKDISLDEGNLLRKLLTKKGTGKGSSEIEAIRVKFIEGCVGQGLTRLKAQDIFEKMEYFSAYGFNLSHAISYCILSYQCAYLLNYYPDEWMAAFLDKEPEARKERAIGIARSFGYTIKQIDINKSGHVWEIGDNKTLIQPLSSIKGLGEAAITQIINNRPFKTIEDFLFNDNIVYSKLNKKCVNVLTKSQALTPLMDERFKNLNHFWMSINGDKPKNAEALHNNVAKYSAEPDFSEEEKVEYLVSLTGLFPTHLVMNTKLLKKLDDIFCPPFSLYDKELMVCHFIPREVIKRKTKNDKDYYIVNVIDSNGGQEQIKCWGVRPDKDKIFINHPYMARLEHSVQWGFSVRSVYKNLKMLG